MIGWKTYTVALLQAVFGALAALDWNPVISNPKAGVWLVVSAVLMAAMRKITTTPPAV